MLTGCHFHAHSELDGRLHAGAQAHLSCTDNPARLLYDAVVYEDPVTPAFSLACNELAEKEAAEYIAEQAGKKIAKHAMKEAISAY